MLLFQDRGDRKAFVGQYELILYYSSEFGWTSSLECASGSFPRTACGVQLVGKHFDEETILKVGWALEQCFGPMEVK